MILDDATQDYIRLALQSHQTCAHETSVLCHALILAEAELRRGYPIESDEEVEACAFFIADATLESLLLKGLIEVEGLSESGEFTIGLTEAGYHAVEEVQKREEENLDE